MTVRRPLDRSVDVEMGRDLGWPHWVRLNVPAASSCPHLVSVTQVAQGDLQKQQLAAASGALALLLKEVFQKYP